MAPTNALIATCIYSDIFDFPLTEKEILAYFVYEKTTQENLRSLLLKNHTIEYKNGFYFLKGRSKIVLLRQERAIISNKKLVIARKVIHVLSFLPTIQLIGISGSIAVQNAQEKDDIDLFIIAQTGSLWTTRLVVNILLLIMGKKRKRGTIDASNAFCANMFMDESNLTLPEIKHNLYSAHEVIQMKPIFVRNNMDKIFIQKNSWLNKFLPNIMITSVPIITKKPNGIISFIETFFRIIQQVYMKKHITTEIIGKNILAFHPHDKEKIIIEIFEKKLKKYEI